MERFKLSIASKNLGGGKNRESHGQANCGRRNQGQEGQVSICGGAYINDLGDISDDLDDFVIPGDNLRNHIIDDIIDDNNINTPNDPDNSPNDWSDEEAPTEEVPRWPRRYEEPRTQIIIRTPETDPPLDDEEPTVIIPFGIEIPDLPETTGHTWKMPIAEA